MSYLSFQFFVFLTILLSLYYLVPRMWMKQGIILAGNIVFLWKAGMDALVIVIGTSLVAYWTTRLIERKYAGYEKEKADLPRKQRIEVFNFYKKSVRIYLCIAFAIMLGIFAYVKIGRYLGWRVSGFVGFSFGKSVIVPLGISYYTFMTIGYILDVYWDKAKVQHNYFKFLLCMTYFPHIVSGPFSRLDELVEQFDHLPKFEYKRFCFGLQLILWGLFQKLVIAEPLNVFITAVKSNVLNYAGVEIIIALIFNTFYVFADFSGYMDIVRGISQVIGVELEENFKQPFFSRSVSEFWRRWHATFGAWMRDYIFMPVTRSKRLRSKGLEIARKSRTGGILFNIGIPTLAVWSFSAVWHGTGLHYILWGIYYCVIQMLGQILKPAFEALSSKLHVDTTSHGFATWQRVRTVGIFCISGSILFCGSVNGCATLWRQMFSELRPWVLFDGSLFNYGLNRREFWMVLFCIAILMLVETLKEKGIKIREAVAVKPVILRWCVYYALIFAVLILGFYGPGYNAADFVYAVF